MDMMRNMRAPDRNITESFLKTLGKVQVDQKGTILYDCHVQFGPLSALLVPADFSRIRVDANKGAALSRKLVKADPDCGQAPLTNAEFCKDRIVLMQRGRVSFAAKYARAIEVGAAALVVVQVSLGLRETKEAFSLY